MLKAEKITKSFMQPIKVDVLRGIDLTVDKGETVAIMGASGEGKSTLLLILGTLDMATSGRLEIDGKRVSMRSSAHLRNARLGFVFQSFHLLPDYNVIDNVLMPARIGRRKEMRLRAESLLERVGLGHRIHFPAKLLSGGEKQRVAIARALCNDPPLIFADEPSGNLDHKTSESIHDLLMDLVREEGKTLVTVTHDQTLADRCDRIYTLQDGVLI